MNNATLPHPLRMAMQKAGIDEIAAAPALVRTIEQDFPGAHSGARFSFPPAFAAGIAEGRRQERARRKDGEAHDESRDGDI